MQLRHVIGRAIPGLPHELRICHVKQEVAADDRTCMQTVLDSDTHLKYLLDRKAELEVRKLCECTTASQAESFLVSAELAVVCVSGAGRG